MSEAQRLDAVENRLEAFNVLLLDMRNNLQDSMDRLDKLEKDLERLNHEITLLIKQNALNMANMGAWYEGRITELKQRLEAVEHFANIRRRKNDEERIL
jgi:CII-binding regulator of phage lambda lysogenization HflD